MTASYRNEKTWDYDAVDIGYRYHLSNVHAAVGLAQIAKLDGIRAARQAACRHYQVRLKTVEGIGLPPTDFDAVNPVLYYIRTTNGKFETAGEQVETAPEGVATRKGDPLGRQINNAIQTLYLNGKMKPILAKWQASQFALQNPSS